jgi:hypothetical protein
MKKFLSLKVGVLCFISAVCIMPVLSMPQGNPQLAKDVREKQRLWREEQKLWSDSTLKKIEQQSEFESVAKQVQSHGTRRTYCIFQIDQDGQPWNIRCLHDGYNQQAAFDYSDKLLIKLISKSAPFNKPPVQMPDKKQPEVIFALSEDIKEVSLSFRRWVPGSSYCD